MTQVQILSQSAEDSKKFIEKEGLHYSCLANIGGKILPFDPRPYAQGDKIPDKLVNENYLWDTKPGLAAAENGELQLNKEFELEYKDPETEAKVIESSASNQYQELIKDATRQQRRLEGAPYSSSMHVLGTKHDNYGAIGAAGPMIQTYWETARRINYLDYEARVAYFLEAFQAKELAREKGVNKFNWEGFTRDNFIKAQPHIQDNVKPEVVRTTYNKFKVELKADAIRYETSIRERTDSFMDIQRDIIEQIPGAMMEVLNTRILQHVEDDATGNKLGNDAADLDGDVGDWTARAPQLSHFTTDPAGALENYERALQKYPLGGLQMLCGMDFVRIYDTNKQGPLAVPPESNQPKERRKGVLSRNSQVNYAIDDHIPDGVVYLARKHNYLLLLQGPKLEFAYKEEMTAGAMEGKVKFDYNNIVTQQGGACYRLTGYKPSA